MKKVVLLLITITCSITTAGAEPNGCYNAQDLEILLSKSSSSLDHMRRCLSDFALPDNRDPATLEKTALLVAKACAQFLPREEDEDLHSFCYGLYLQNPTVMSGALKKLKPREQQIVEESYKEMRKANRVLKGQMKH